ncbi:hypothetical protein [Micromonospora chokoriensis]
MRSNVSLTVKARIAIALAATAVTIGLFGATAAHAEDASGSTPAPAATPTPSTTASPSQPWG